MSEPQKLVPALLVLALLALSPLSFAHRGPGGEVTVPDPHDDVKTEPGGLAPSHDLAKMADIWEVRVFNESGLDFQVGVQVAGLPHDQTGGTNRILDVHVCFEVAEKLLIVAARVTIAGDGEISSNAMMHRKPDNLCPVQASAGGHPAWISTGDLKLDINPEIGLILFTIPKPTTYRLLENRSVGPGLDLGSIRASARASQANTVVRFVDWVPDAAPAEDVYQFKETMANELLTVEMARETKYGSTCVSYIVSQTAVVEAGGPQAIPLLLKNFVPEALNVNLTAHTHIPGWEVQVRPEVNVPAARLPTPGQANITLVVNAVADSAKSCGWVQVKARDNSDATRLGEIFMEVVASRGPAKDRNTLYFHRPYAYAWTFGPDGALFTLNTYPTDHTADPEYRKLLIHSLNGQVVSNQPYTFAAATDTPYPFHILLESGGTAEAKLWLDSQPQGVTTKARINVGLRSGKELVGFGTQDVTITSEGSELVIPVHVEPPVWRGPTRGLTANQMVFVDVGYEPLPVAPGVDARPAGRVYFTPAKSSITLPIVDIQRTNTLGLGTEGGFVTLRLDESNQTKLVNPGRTVLFNFTLANEALDADDFHLQANVTATNGGTWSAGIVGGPMIRAVPPGATRQITLGVLAPAAAPEGSTASIVVDVHGSRDGAKTSALAIAQVSRDQDHGSVDNPLTLKPVAKDTPGPGALAVAVVAAIVASMTMRRARRE